MIRYEKRLRPILECIGLLEHYVNQDLELKHVDSLSTEQNDDLKEWYSLIEEAGSTVSTRSIFIS